MHKQHGLYQFGMHRNKSEGLRGTVLREWFLQGSVVRPTDSTVSRERLIPILFG